MKNLFPLISLGNEARVAIDTGADLLPGTIALANETRFNASHYSESLTQFSTGYSDPENLLALTDYVAPPVQVGRRFDWKNADQSKYFLTEIDDERPIGGGFKKVEFGGTEVNAKTKNRGLMTVIDIDENGGAIDETAITASLLQRIFRNKYRRAITALLAIKAGEAVTFNNTSQPDEILKAALADAQLECGVYPNRGLIGLAGWNLRSSAYAAQNNAGATAQLMKSLQQVAGDLFLDELRVDKTIYQQTTAAKGRIVPASFIGFHGRDGLTKDDPSSLKQFWTPVQGGGRYRVYRRVYGPADKFIEITIEHYEQIYATSTIGASRKNIS